ncbi:hypothetical protein GN956_G10604 [Arapaima gigas]
MQSEWHMFLGSHCGSHNKFKCPRNSKAEKQKEGKTEKRSESSPQLLRLRQTAAVSFNSSGSWQKATLVSQVDHSHRCPFTQRIWASVQKMIS